MSDGIGVSLVIVTFNRKDELLRLLESLNTTLHRDDVELVLVDDQSTDGTIEAVQDTLGYMGDRLVVIPQAKDGPGVGRNRGIARARGEVIAFIDTDCVAHDGWLNALTEQFEDETVGAVGGPDRSHPTDPLLTQLIDYLMTSFLTTGGVRGAKKAKGGSYHPRSFNMAVRKDAATAIDGFPVIWYGEDILFSWRVGNKGYKLTFAPDAWVYHRRRTSVRGWMRQLYRMGRARWWMGRYDRSLLDPIYMLPLLEWLGGLGIVSATVAGAACNIPSLYIAGAAMLGLAGIYFTAVGVDALAKTRKWIALPGVPIMFLIREAAYAAGSLAGIMTRLPDMEGALPRIKDDA